MILWSIQNAAAWAKAERAGVLRADGRTIDRDYLPAYAWMTRQMERRIGKRPRAVRHPVWAWLQCDDVRRARPDLRHSGHLLPGTKGVRIELEVPAECVLLSDFELWHYVLNRWYLPRTERDRRAFERMPQNTPGARARMKESWQRIFDIASPNRDKSIQATLWQLPLASVRSVKAFTAR